MNKLKLTSCPDSIGELELFIQNLTRQYGICQERYPDILISLTEAVNNAIIHGNEANTDKKVCIEHDYENNRLTFRISDEGTGFDYNNLPDPTRLENLENIGGRGVFLMQKLADRLQFHDNGSTVVIDFNM